jgi:hypothetical protein
MLLVDKVMVADLALQVKVTHLSKVKGGRFYAVENSESSYKILLLRKMLLKI